MHTPFAATALRRTVRAVGTAAVVFAGTIGMWASAASAQEPAAEETPLAKLVAPEERVRYDVVYLNDRTKTVLKTAPLDLPERRVPDQPKPDDYLTLRLLEDESTPFRVKWRHVERVELFEQQVLADALRLLADGRFDETYRYLVFLRLRYPHTQGLADAQQQFLTAEAEHWRLQQRYENEWALLGELHALNPNDNALGAAIVACAGHLIDQHLGAAQFASARQILDQVQRWYPQRTADAKLSDKLADRAQQWSRRAAEALERGDHRAASDAARQAVAIWPKLSGLPELAARAVAEYPQVAVGVTSFSTPAWRLDDWASRRQARLVTRELIELEGLGAEGGRYRCPLGSIELLDLNRRVMIHVAANQQSGAASPPTGYSLSRQLLRLLDPHHAAFQSRLAAEISGLEVSGAYELTIDFHHSHMQPEALLYSSLMAAQRTTGEPLVPLGGPYEPGDAQATGDAANSAQPAAQRYVARADYFARQPQQPQEIVEQFYDSGAAALEALRAGEVQVVDRLAPWHLATIVRDDHLTVARYAVPTVHCLLANPQRPLTSSRTFRRALVFAIDRATILEKVLFNGTALTPGCKVVSGPLPQGVQLDDPLRYAYDEQIAPRPYDPRMAITLSAVAMQELAADDESPEPSPRPTLALAHPPTNTARRACEAIAAYLRRVGLEVELRPWGVGQPPPPADGQFDLVYTELALPEPSVDVAQVLSRDGLTRTVTPVMELALRRLAASSGWSEVRDRLHDVHRLAHDDVTVIPLWQLTEHFAYRSGLEGIGPAPLTLYDRVEQWRVEAPLLAGREP